jgi:hypothetical protein
MKKNRPTAILIAVFSIIIIVVLVASFALNTLVTATPAAPAPTIANTVPPTATNTLDPCSQGNIRATVVDFDKISREFDDAFVLAQNTPAAQLAGNISEMQRVRRNAQDYAVPSCLGALKEYQLDFMNTAIDASLVLYSKFSGDPSKTMTQDQANAVIAQVNQDMAQAVDYSNKYRIEMARLLGITLTPSPTISPETTPFTVQVTTTP